MLGNRNLHHKFSKAQCLQSLEDEREQDPINADFLKRLYLQAKQVSQIIAYIWRWVDEEDEQYIERKINAEQLMTYFTHPTSTSDQNCDPDKPIRQGDHLKLLFKANPRDSKDRSLEANLLRAVFKIKEGEDEKNKYLIFPIFNIYERGEKEGHIHNGYLFEISVNAFTGSIDDADINSPELLKMIIPYPPRPPFGKATLEKKNLDEWIEDRTEKYFADNHYIPTSCS